MRRIHLCFHGVGLCHTEREPGEAAYWISEEMFTSVLDLVKNVDFVDLSFDDGNRSDVDIALPALTERGLDATFFVLAARLDDPLSLRPRDLQALLSSGMQIGSHGWRHIPWQGLSAADAEQEFFTARVKIEQTVGQAIDSAALPLGRYDRRALSALRRAGYRRVYTSDRYPARRSAWLQPRYSLKSSDTMDSVRSMLAGSSLRTTRNLLVSKIKRLR